MMRKSVTTLFAGAILLAGTNLYAQQKGDAAKGKEVFDQCSVCHNSDSTDVKVGPGLKGLFKKDKMTSAPDKKPTEANILQKINEGGNGMPSYMDVLSAQDKANLIAYLKTL